MAAAGTVTLSHHTAEVTLVLSKVAYLTLCGGSMTGEGQQRHGTERPVGTDPQLIGTVWISAPHGQAGRPGSASEAQVLLRPTTPPRGAARTADRGTGQGRHGRHAPSRARS